MAWRTWKTGCLAKVETEEEYNSVMKTVPTTTRPKFIEDFGYEYTDEGKLVRSDCGKPFAWLGQRHYDALGDAIVPSLQRIMVEKLGLVEKRLPVDADAEKEPTTNIFMSPDALTADTLVLLIQGSGAVRAGMWARALCINETLSLGTIFPYLDKIKERGWGVIVFNPNNTHVVDPPPKDEDVQDKVKYWLGTPDDVYKKEFEQLQEAATPIRENDLPSEHCTYVWDKFVTQAKAKDLLVIAHSAGGRCTRVLLKEKGEEFLSRVRGVAFTDAKWKKEKPGQNVNGPLHKLLKPLTINWAASDTPLDTKLPALVEMGPIAQRSAGHPKHEWTSAACMESVFAFLDGKLAEK
eukprot:TRINITY_DN20939_c0_g1_i1.p1 TRINITY_DN20939_c0_g1~~TRINITY_DN20939_c0_g1_i1.p1  ORF type:complete len:359 (+),score=40.11 TRINITY_DN20939_c0_g1_i1:27-1079(+)